MRRGKKMFLWGLGVVAVVLVGLLVWGYGGLRSYLQSEGFREFLEDELAEGYRGEASINGLVWDGWQISGEEVRVADTNEVQVVRLSGLEARVAAAALWSGAYKITGGRIDEVAVMMDLTTERGVSPEFPEKEKKWWSDWLPDKYDVSPIEIVSLTGEVKTSRGVWQWGNGYAVVTPGNNLRTLDLVLEDFQVRQPVSLFPEFHVKQAKLRIADRHCYLLESTLMGTEHGRVELFGEFAMDEREWQLRGKASELVMARLVSRDWKRRLRGTLGADFWVKEQTMEADVFLRDGVITALPVLDQLATYVDTARFRNLELKEAQARMRYENRQIEVSEILLVSEGALRVEGSLQIEVDGRVFGVLQLGVPPGVLARIPGAEARVFHPGKLGLQWTPVRISGTVDAIEQDLTARLVAAAGMRLVENMPETGKALLKQGGTLLKDQLERSKFPDLSVPELGGEVIDRGLDQVFELFGGPEKKEE